jgi:ecdysteroid kinase
MSTIPIETTPEAISCEWLSKVFHMSGALPVSASLESFTYKPIGTGQMSNSFRVIPTWSNAENDLKSFVIKLPSEDEGSRMAGESMGIYDVEVNFYKSFAPKLNIRTPHCYFAGIAENKVDFVLVLEDVAPAEQGDQMAGCTIEQARLAIREVTKLHSPFFNDPILKKTQWLNRGGDTAAAFRPLLKGFYQGFCERYQDRIEPAVIAMGQRYYDGIEEYAEPIIEPFSLVHTDYRLDNMLFATPKGGPEITVVDWQTVSCGSPMNDVAYFIGAGLHMEERRNHEEDLVRLYHDIMLEAGAKDFSWETCWDLYRANSFAGFMMAVMASMLVERTDRGDEMFVTMARRHGHQILDLDAESFLKRPI